MLTVPTNDPLPRPRTARRRLRLAGLADLATVFEGEMTMKVFIPDNGFGIVEGYYNQRQLCELLRRHRESPAAIQFIADMLE